MKAEGADDKCREHWHVPKRTAKNLTMAGSSDLPSGSENELAVCQSGKKMKSVPYGSKHVNSIRSALFQKLQTHVS